jgi:hypothetical protein
MSAFKLRPPGFIAGVGELIHMLIVKRISVGKHEKEKNHQKIPT